MHRLSSLLIEYYCITIDCIKIIKHCLQQRKSQYSSYNINYYYTFIQSQSLLIL